MHNRWHSSCDCTQMDVHATSTLLHNDSFRSGALRRTGATWVAPVAARFSAPVYIIHAACTGLDTVNSRNIEGEHRVWLAGLRGRRTKQGGEEPAPACQLACPCCARLLSRKATPAGRAPAALGPRGPPASAPRRRVPCLLARVQGGAHHASASWPWPWLMRGLQGPCMHLAVPSPARRAPRPAAPTCDGANAEKHQLFLRLSAQVGAGVCRGCRMQETLIARHYAWHSAWLPRGAAEPKPADSRRTAAMP